jgi:hypothetical protein
MQASAPQAMALAMSPERPSGAVGDDVDVAAAGLVQVVAARGGDVGHRRRHRNLDAEHVPSCAVAAPPKPTSTPAAPARIRCSAAW